MTATEAQVGTVSRLPVVGPPAASGELLRSYTAYMHLAGLRPRTVEARLSVLDSLARQVAPRSLAEVTRADAEQLVTRPSKPESRRAYRSNLKAFFGWALEEGLVGEDPTRRLPPIRVPRAVPRPISTAELTAAVSVADARMRAWLLLMALGGLRCMEVAGLRPGDLLATDSGPVLSLRECKGGGAATMPAHPRIVEALGMVPMRNGVWWDCDHRTVSRLVGLHLRAAGVQATAHRLRHYAGTVWYQASGHDILTTARLLRHASISTTQIYARAEPGRATEVVNLVGMELPE